jgi:hypothetical protein
MSSHCYRAFPLRHGEPHRRLRSHIQLFCHPLKSTANLELLAFLGKSFMLRVLVIWANPTNLLPFHGRKVAGLPSVHIGLLIG